MLGARGEIGARRVGIVLSALVLAVVFLATLTPDQFEGRDDIPLTYKIIDGFGFGFESFDVIGV